jgi:hypothetical protein
MGKREIERALKAKGLDCLILEYGYQITPGEVVGGWEIELSETSENLVASVDPYFSDWEPDCFNSTDALEWVASLPDCRAAALKEV